MVNEKLQCSDGQIYRQDQNQEAGVAEISFQKHIAVASLMRTFNIIEHLPNNMLLDIRVGWNFPMRDFRSILNERIII